MKFFGWMHRKQRDNSPRDVFKEFGGGGSCNCFSAHPSSPTHYDTSLLALAAVDVGAHISFPTISSDFLLSIGTLGTFSTIPIPGDNESDLNEDTTGTDKVDLPVLMVENEKTTAMVEAIAEKEAELTTEGDLMVVTAELEKVLASVGVENTISSARVSFAVGSGCPLQGFLFGSPMAVAETTVAVEEKRREATTARASLGELFLRTRYDSEKMANGAGGCEKDEEEVDELLQMKKEEKRKVAAITSAAKGKFQKVLQMFHRKVHPENTTVIRKPMKNRKYGTLDHEHHGGDKDPTCHGAHGITTSEFTSIKEHMPNFNCCSNRALLLHDESNTDKKSGHWIRTDADYLVLEL